MKLKSHLKPGGHSGSSSRGRYAFSLVEVTIALAIAAIGFLTLLGLLPHGIEMARQSSELSMGSKILQKLSGELQTQSWDKITWTGYGARRYFTDEGVEIPASELNNNTGLSSALTYVASIYVPAPTLDVLLPSGTGKGGAQAGSSEPYIRRVKIAITTTTNPQFDFSNAPRQRVVSRSVLLAKTEE